MKLRYTFRNSGPYRHKQCFCTLTLPANEMVLLLLDANVGLHAMSTPGGDVTVEEAARYSAKRYEVLQLVKDIEDREKKVETILRDDVD
jgi:hypothetical protein